MHDDIDGILFDGINTGRLLGCLMLVNKPFLHNIPM